MRSLYGAIANSVHLEFYVEILIPVYLKGENKIINNSNNKSALFSSSPSFPVLFHILKILSVALCLPSEKQRG